MNIHRYLLPTSFAAATHVALFLALPRETWFPPDTIIEVPLPPWPPKPEDVVALPPDDPTPSVAPVKALGGPTPPVAPEPAALPRPDGTLIPEPASPFDPKRNLPTIPTTAGFENGDGHMPWEVGDRGRIIDYSKLDRVPHAKVQIAPEYPMSLRNSGTTGSVKVEFDVDKAGRVIDARVLASSHREFEETTLRAVRKWRFEPGKRNGRAVPFRIVVPVEFGLETR